MFYGRGMGDIKLPVKRLCKFVVAVSALLNLTFVFVICCFNKEISCMPNAMDNTSLCLLHD